MSKKNKPDAALVQLINATASENREVRETAQNEFAVAISEPLRSGELVGDIVRGMFTDVETNAGTTVEWPLDLLAPGEEDEFVAYTHPGNGRIPERNVEGDYVRIPTYRVANSIDWLLRYAKDAGFNVVKRALEVYNAGFVKKLNDDGWHTVLSAAADRNMVVYDADATAGVFTKRLVSLAKTTMRRNGGGNTGSKTRKKVTDIYLSPEGLEDIRNWNLDQIDETTRREIFLAGDQVISRIFGVNLHDLDEFGEQQEYQLYFTNNLGMSLAGGDLEMALALDLSTNDSMIMAVGQEVQTFADPALHRQMRQGYYGWAEMGFGVLDSRIVLPLSF